MVNSSFETKELWGHMSVKEALASMGIELIQERLGEGGSAWVHRARIGEAPSFGLPPGTALAVKEYKPELLGQHGQLERVRQEARLGVRVRHRNVVAVHALLPDDLHAPPLDDLTPRFLVMEWIDGVPLTEWNATHGAAADWSTLRTIADGILAGLEELHRNGVRHRDIKPENVMLRSDETPVVMDVGVAEIVDGQEHTLHTTMGTFLGSVRYASPQYLLDSKYELADDVYGAGATLFELFTGQRMFDGIERKPHLAAIIIGEGVRVERLRPGVPDEVAVLLRQMLHRTREARPTLEDVRAALSDPAKSDYLRFAAEQQRAHEQGFRVIEVRENGNSLLVDLAGKQIAIGARMVLLRRGNVRLPSAGRTVLSEEWIGEAVVKHAVNSVGHLLLVHRRWQKGEPATGMRALFGAGGEWIEDEHSSRVKVGDWAVERN